MVSSINSRMAIVLVVIVGLFLGAEAGMNRREVKGTNKNQAQEPAWQPATGPREFTVNVDDQIRGANQFRHEKWNNGTVEGSYAAPGRDGKWLKVNYKGDSKGFQIISTEEIKEDMFGGSSPAKDHTAHIDIEADGKPVEYTVTEDQLKASNKANQQKTQPKQ